MSNQARTWYYFTNEPNEEDAVRYAKTIFYRPPMAILAGKVASGETLVALRFSIAVVPRVPLYKGSYTNSMDTVPTYSMYSCK
jgi:hypothetical protein